MIGEGGKERRQRVSFDSILDALSTAKGGTYLTLCYISEAKIGKTLTGKNINIDKFGNDIEQYQRKGTRGYDVLKNFHQGGASRKNTLPVGIIKRSVITFHWQTEDNYGKAYGKYKQGVNNLLKPYGVELGSRDEKHDEKQNFGGGNVSVGATDNTKGKLYTHQNGAVTDRYETSYFMVKDGKLYGGLNKNAIASLVSKSDPEGVKALRELGVQENEIKKYIQDLKNLNFSILKLMYERILWVSCKIDGVKKFAINDRFTDHIGSGSNTIPINPNVFLKLANNKYDAKYNPLKDDTENYPITHVDRQKYYDMYGESVNRNNKKLVRLTESDLHAIVKNAVRKLVNEAVNPLDKIQALIQQANEAYHNAAEKQGGDKWPLMDKEGDAYGLSGDIKLDGRGYVIIPYNGWQYGGHSEPVKIRVIQRVGGKLRVIQGDTWDEGWKDVRKMLLGIIQDAGRGNGYFEKYDPNWESSDTPEDYKNNQSALKAMNKQIGRKASTGMDYLSKSF